VYALIVLLEKLNHGIDCGTTYPYDVLEATTASSENVYQSKSSSRGNCLLNHDQYHLLIHLKSFSYTIPLYAFIDLDHQTPGARDNLFPNTTCQNSDLSQVQN